MALEARLTHRQVNRFVVTLHDSLLSSSARPLSIRRRPDLDRAPPPLPGPQLLDRQGPGGAELLPLPGRGIRPAELAGRQHQPRRVEGPLRGRVSPAEDHPGRAPAVPRHVAPQRAGDRRRGRPGQAVAQAPPRTPPQGIPRRPGQRPLHPLQGLRPRTVPQLALSAGELVLQPAWR